MNKKAINLLIDLFGEQMDKEQKRILASGHVLSMILTITPDIAKTILEFLNVENRKIKKDVTRKMIIAMQSGRWMFTHEAMAFDVCGALLDGQHRLVAIVESDTTLKFVVVFNLEQRVREVINIASARKVHERLNMVGHKWVTDKHAAIVANIVDGAYGVASKYDSNIAAYERVMATVREGLEFATSFSGPKSLYTVPVLCQIVRGFYNTDIISHDKLKEFMTTLRDGASLTGPGSAVAHLRDIMIRSRAGSTDRRSRKEIFWLTAEALLHFAKGEVIEKLEATYVERFNLPKGMPGETPRLTRRYPTPKL